MSCCLGPVRLKKPFWIPMGTLWLRGVEWKRLGYPSVLEWLGWTGYSLMNAIQYYKCWELVEKTFFSFLPGYSILNESTQQGRRWENKICTCLLFTSLGELSLWPQNCYFLCNYYRFFSLPYFSYLQYGYVYTWSIEAQGGPIILN